MLYCHIIKFYNFYRSSKILFVMLLNMLKNLIVCQWKIIQNFNLNQLNEIFSIEALSVLGFTTVYCLILDYSQK